MKCVCGYEHECGMFTKDPPLKGDEPFIDISGSTFMRNDTGYGYGRKVEIYLMACPKCGTIKTEI